MLNFPEAAGIVFNIPAKIKTHKLMFILQLNLNYFLNKKIPMEAISTGICCTSAATINLTIKNRYHLKRMCFYAPSTCLL